MLKSEIDFLLSQPVDYTTKEGTIESANQIALFAPTKAQNKLRMKLKQGLTQTMFELSQSAKGEAKEGDKEGEIDAEAIIMLLYASKLDLEAYSKTFEQLVINGAGTIGGMPITQAIYDRISLDDADRMLGEYLANFMMLSAPTTKKPK